MTRIPSTSVWILALGAFLILGSLPTPGLASCDWRWVCTGPSQTSCQYVPVCDNALDLPGVPPAQPVPPIPSLALPPAEIPPIPPIGAQHCFQAQDCGEWGSCQWRWFCE